ncbi:hypothetical protein N7524_004720, partial [Penicillium chrysogenum]
SHPYTTSPYLYIFSLVSHFSLREIRLFARELSSYVVLLVIVYRTLYYSSSFASYTFSEALRISYFELPNLVSSSTLKSPMSKIRIADLYRAFTLLIRNYIDTHGLHPRYLNTRHVSYRN